MRLHSFYINRRQKVMVSIAVTTNGNETSGWYCRRKSCVEPARISTCATICDANFRTCMYHILVCIHIYACMLLRSACFIYRGFRTFVLSFKDKQNNEKNIAVHVNLLTFYVNHPIV